MPDPCAYDYVVVRVVPRVDREEFFNAGVVLYCHDQRFLQAMLRLDTARLAALAPTADAAPIQRHLDSMDRICRGDPSAGPIARLPLKERFGWLAAPRSTVIQQSPVHRGRCEDPAQALQRIFDTMVR